MKSIRANKTNLQNILRINDFKHPCIHRHTVDSCGFNADVKQGIPKKEMEKNIFIWYNYRCGSTPYQSLLSQEYNLKNYLEPFHERQKGIHDTENFFNKIALDPTPFIVKATPLHIENIRNRQTLHYNFHIEIDKLLDSSHVILMTRKNKVEAIASMYVATKTGKWYQHVDSKQEYLDYDMNIDQETLQKICREYADNDQLLQSKNFKEKIEYENLDFTGINDYIKQSKPKNYRNIIQEIYLFVFDYHPELLTKDHH